MIELKGGYTRYNFLLKVKAVCEIYVKHSNKGVSAEYIYKEYIKDVFFISRRTFFAYLTIPYARELKIEKEKAAERKRLREKKREEEAKKAAERERIKAMQQTLFDNE